MDHIKMMLAHSIHWFIIRINLLCSYRTPISSFSAAPYPISYHHVIMCINPIEFPIKKGIWLER